MLKYILLLYIATAACGTPKTSRENTPTVPSTISTDIKNETVKLGLKEEIMIGDLQVQFIEVMEDSRCPTDTECFWQGRARLLIETHKKGDAPNQHEIIFGKLQQGEVENHTFYNSGTTIISAKAINPYPTNESGTTNLVYELVLEVRS